MRGFRINPQGTGGGIAGDAGDSAGGTIDDVSVVDTGAAGTQAGLELTGTAGTFNVTNFVVTNQATGVLLDSAGTADFGSTTITSNGGPGLSATGTNMGSSTFDAITVTGSDNGGVSMSGTTGATTFGDGNGVDLALTTASSPTAAFSLSNAGTVVVEAAGVDNVAANGGPAIDVTGTIGAALAFDDVDSTGSTTDGINLAGLGAGMFSATSGDITGATGIAFDVEGGSGAVTYAGDLQNGTGHTAEISARTGGAVTVSGAIADTNDGGGGVSLVGNTGGSTTFSNASKVLNTTTATAVSFASSAGHTLTFSGGGLDIDTTTGAGLSATSSGTLVVEGANNTIDTATGRALSVTNTVIGAADLTFQSVSSNGAPSGILLDTTGTAGSLVVTGNGGTCTNADTSGCSGGRIRNSTGGDDSSQTPVGTGIVLRNTAAPSLTRMWLHDHSNYAIRGNSVTDFTLANSVVNGTNGNNGANPFDEGGIILDNLTGSASVSDSAISGGFENDFRVNNTAGSLNRLTISSSTFGVNSVGTNNDAIGLSSTATAGQLQATIQNSTFTRAAGDHVDYSHNGTGTGDFDLFNNDFSNSFPPIATGGGLTLSNSGTSGTTTMNIDGNTFRDAVGPGVLIFKTTGSSTQTGTFTDNTIGVAGVANSGSAEGSALKLQTTGRGTVNWTVTNNQIRGYNNHGIEVLAGGGAEAEGGAINTTITGNSITQPGNTAAMITIPKQGVHFDIGTLPGDTYQACGVITDNDLATSGADGIPPTGVDADVRLRQRQSTTIRLPGYAGVATDTTAVQNFVAAQNPGGTAALAQVNSPPGGGFIGTGATCP